MKILQIFQDSKGKISSKRVAGFMLIISAIVLIVLDKGQAGNVQAMLYAGVAALGVGTFETRVQK